MDKTFFLINYWKKEFKFPDTFDNKLVVAELPTMQAKQRNRRSYTTKHSQHMIDLAVDALQNKTMSSYDAEKIFGIPRRTLLDKLHNKHPKSPGCPTRLNDQEEANIIKVLLAAAEFGSPLTLLDLRIVVHR